MGAQHNVNSATSVGSAIALGTLASLSFIVQPALVQGYVTHLGVSEARALDLAGIEMFGMAISATLVAFRGHRLPWRRTVAVALLTAAMGNSLSAQWAGSESFFWARLIAGLGHGGITTLSFTLVGITLRADRNIALFLTALLGYGAIGICVMPEFLSEFGIAGLFGSFAVLLLAGLATTPLIPPTADARVELPESARDLHGVQQLVALVGKLAYNVAQGIAWAVLFLVGVAAGIGEQRVAGALFISQLMAVVGALCSVFLAGRIARDRAIMVGILGGGLCIAALVGRPGWLLFLGCVCGFNLLWNFVLPSILSMLGEFDTRGKMIGRAVAMQMIGLSIGPFAASLLVSGNDYTRVELVCAGCFAASFILLTIPMRAHAQMLGSVTIVETTT